MGAMASQITSLTCLFNRSFRRRSNKTSKLRVTGLCEGNSPVTGEFPAQMASNAEKGSHLMTSSRCIAVCSLLCYVPDALEGSLILSVDGEIGGSDVLFKFFRHITRTLQRMTLIANPNANFYCISTRQSHTNSV